MQNVPTVSIIIPVWNGESTIVSVIQSVIQQSYPAELLQIIVVDNGSTDSTRESVLQFGKDVLLLHEPTPGSYAARNTGLSHASGRYVAFTDADCIADRHWIANAVRVLQADPNIGIVAGRIEVVAAEGFSRIAFLIERELSFKQNDVAARGACVTANWVSSRNVINAAGGFDASLKSGGDYVLSKRISNGKHPVRYVAEAVVLHPARGSISDLLNKRRRVMGGAWARQNNSPLRLLRWELTGCLHRIRTVLKAPDIRRSEKAVAAFVVVLMMAVSVFELARLKVGGKPRRA